MFNEITTIINIAGVALLLILAYYMTILITKINGHIKIWYTMPLILGMLAIFRTITVIDNFFNATGVNFVEIGSWVVPIIWFALIIVTRKTSKTISNLHLDIDNLEAEAKILKTEAKIQHSEDVRQIAEHARQVAEEARIKAEEARVYAEGIRTEIFAKLKTLFSKL